MATRSEDEYEDLLGLWADLESGLGVILTNPDRVQEFELRVTQYDQWMQSLLQADTQLGLYQLFQLASSSPVGYSASHALVCAVLSHLIATDLGLDAHERDALVYANLTMNIGMTALQDRLAGQLTHPSKAQQEAIAAHAVKGSLMLVNKGVTNALWLDTVRLHHADDAAPGGLLGLTPTLRLARIVAKLDRYAAMISPRQTRAGQTATESARNLMGDATNPPDEVASALLRCVGLCPPGTFVRLDNAEVAVVLRQSKEPNKPFVAVVINPQGEAYRTPRLRRLEQNGTTIQTALAASSVQAHLNHHLILQLNAEAAVN